MLMNMVFEGLLPEQVSFDAEGKSLAVVIFNYREPSPKTGAVEFWNVIEGDKPRLERTGYKIDVVRGAHDIKLVALKQTGERIYSIHSTKDFQA